jgi:hypothetical protein
MFACSAEPPFDPDALLRDGAPWDIAREGGGSGPDEGTLRDATTGTGDAHACDACDGGDILDGAHDGAPRGDAAEDVADASDAGAPDAGEGGVPDASAGDGAADVPLPPLGRAPTEPQRGEARVLARRVWAGAERICFLHEGIVQDGARLTQEAPRRVCVATGGLRDDPFELSPTVVPSADAMYARASTERVGEYLCVVDSGTLRCSHSYRGEAPTLPPAMNDVSSVAVGNQAVCVVTHSGSLRCVGTVVNGPSALETPPLTGVRKVGVGRGLACALADGGVHCFRLSGTDRTRPVPALVRPRDIAIADDTACALDDSRDPDDRSRGGVVCWNASTGARRQVLRTVLEKHDWKRVLVRDFGVCVADDNEVQCWGDAFDTQGSNAQRFRVRELLDFDFFNALGSRWIYGRVCFSSARDGITCRDQPSVDGRSPLVSATDARVAFKAHSLPLGAPGGDRLVCVEDAATPTTGALYRVAAGGSVRRIDDALCASLRVAPGGQHYLYRKGTRLWVAGTNGDAKREVFAWPSIDRCNPDSVAGVEACILAREAQLTDAHEYFADFADEHRVVLSRRTDYLYEGLYTREWECWRSPSRPNFRLFCYDRYQRMYAFDAFDLRTSTRTTLLPAVPGLFHPHLSLDRSHLVYQTADRLHGTPEDHCRVNPSGICPLKRVCPSGVALRAFEFSTGVDRQVARAEGERCTNPFPSP